MLYLQRDPLHYAGMLSILDDQKTRIVRAEKHGVYLINNDLGYISAQNMRAAKKLIYLLESSDVLAYEPLLHKHLRKQGFSQVMSCYPCRYEGTEPIKFQLPPEVEIKRLTHEYDAFIYAHYHLDDEDYLFSRMDEGMFGIFERNTLAGFIGVHDNGEIGLLEILPDYRRKGYATLLESFMINRQLSKGLLPRGEVETWNTSSLQLQEKLGMTISTQTCTWFSRKTGKGAESLFST